MLNSLIAISRWISNICALLAPCVLLHWILKIIDIPVDFIRGIITFLDGFFTPIADLAALFVPYHNTFYFNGKTFDSNEGVLGVLCIVIFVVGQAFQNTFIKMKEEVEKRKEQELIAKELAEQLKAQQQTKKKIITQEDTVVYVQYPFAAGPLEVASIIDTFMKYNGKLLANRAGTQSQTGRIVHFDRLEYGLNYARDVRDAIEKYYASLRPMDKKPAFFVTAAVRDEDTVEFAMALCEFILRYCPNNEVIVSDATRDYVQHLDMNARFPLYSAGMYQSPTQQMFELFRLG